jgi:integrase/recombinase XerD
VMQVLKDYLAARDRAGAPRTAQSGVFWNPGRERRYSYVAVRDNMAKVIRRAGLKPLSGIAGPRVHDLRHSSGSRIIPASNGRCGDFPGDRAIWDALMAA